MADGSKALFKQANEKTETVIPGADAPVPLSTSYAQGNTTYVNLIK